RPHDRAARAALDEPLDLQAMQRFAHGSAARAELRGEGVLREYPSALEGAAEDRLADPFVCAGGHVASSWLGWSMRAGRPSGRPTLSSCRQATEPARRPKTMPAARPEPPG